MVQLSCRKACFILKGWWWFTEVCQAAFRGCSLSICQDLLMCLSFSAAAVTDVKQKKNPTQSSSLSFHTTFDFCAWLCSLIPITLMISISEKSENFSLKNLRSTQKIYCNKTSQNVDHMYRPLGEKNVKQLYIFIIALFITSSNSAHWFLLFI